MPPSSKPNPIACIRIVRLIQRNRYKSDIVSTTNPKERRSQNASDLFGLSVAGMTRAINELQVLVDRVKKVPTEPKAARKKYGASLCRHLVRRHSL